MSPGEKRIVIVESERVLEKDRGRERRERTLRVDRERVRRNRIMKRKGISARRVHSLQVCHLWELIWERVEKC